MQLNNSHPSFPKEKKLLPIEASVFSTFAGSLGILSGVVSLGGIGRSIAVRIKKIREFSERANKIEARCKQIEEEIKELEKSGQTTKAIAKRVLFNAMTVRLNVIRQIWISHEIFNLTEETLNFSQSGQGLTKDLLVLLGASKSAIATTGMVGLGLLAGNITLKLSKLFLFEKSSITKWKDEIQLAGEQKTLRKEISKFHTSVLSTSNKLFSFEQGVNKIRTEEAQKICNEELSRLFEDQQKLQRKFLKKISNMEEAKKIKLEMNKNSLMIGAIIDINNEISSLKENEISVSKLIEMKQKAFSQLNSPIMYEYEHKEQQIDTKKAETQENFEKSKKNGAAWSFRRNVRRVSRGSVTPVGFTSSIV